MRSQIWDLGTRLKGPKIILILLASPKLHFSLLDIYHSFDLNLKYIHETVIHVAHSSRYETLGFFALVFLRETCVCLGYS